MFEWRDGFLTFPRSNKMFAERGLKKKILYQECLSTSRNPDFVTRHPNETKERNSANWKMEIKKRVEHEEDLARAVIKVRLQKQTSVRRLNEL